MLSGEDLAVGENLFSSVVGEKSEANFGKNFDCEMGLASFLYAFIVLNRPSIVIETGVANGITTNVIMAALEITGGTLHSFDVDERTKNVYSGKGRWHFHLLKNDFEADLVRQVSEIGKLDLWVHDSNHGYKWQTFEYGLAVSYLNVGGILVSDDIDSSTAWGLASKSMFKKSYGIFDARKFFGVAIV
jgi:predicted O-methyltransferase YrrM